MKILIAGDSFAADWQKQKSSYLGWPNLLANDFDVTNIAQAGVSQYKILCQLRSLDLSVFDVIIVCFTSDFRLHIPKHPIHSNSILHKDCDLLYSDLNFHVKKIKNLFNFKLWISYLWYIISFDYDYYTTISSLIKKEIFHLAMTQNCLFITDSDLEIKELFHQSRGSVNHLSEEANYQVYECVKRRLYNVE
jgi:hypothetical protein